MPACARITDPVSCGDQVKLGSSNVFANNIAVARIGDSTLGHGCFPPTTLSTGSSNVFVNNIPCAFVTSAIIPHSCGGVHGGNVATGSPNVFVNS